GLARDPPRARAGPPPPESPRAAQVKGGEPARGGPASPPPRPAPPRRTRRDAPRPKLSQAALEGKVPLRTFGELSALFAAKQTPEKKAPAEPAPPAPAAQQAPVAAPQQAVATESPPASDNGSAPP